MYKASRARRRRSIRLGRCGSSCHSEPPAERTLRRDCSQTDWPPAGASRCWWKIVRAPPVWIGAFVAANDDHTLLFAPVGTFTVHPYEHEKLPYDVERDLLPIASVSTIILAVSTSAALKVESLGELVELARAQPGKLNAAAANGNADFLLFGFLKSTGLQVAKVPYRDILQAPNDLAEGRIQVLMTSFAVVQPQMQTGKVKVLAVTSRNRAPTAPEVPTVKEAGYPELELESLVG